MKLNGKIKIDISNEILKKYAKKFRNATLMDDIKFRQVCESKEVIEEILSAILNDEEIKVLESIKQKTEDEPVFHGVILDCRCKLKSGEIVNIEVQMALDDDPMYRMRYNEAMLTVENSPKSKMFKYKKIPKVILIMFCNFDLFKLNRAIYEVKRIVEGTKIIADNGIRELYINLKAKVANKKLKSLFKILTTTNEVDTNEFPELSKRKEEINKLYLGGENNMSGLALELYKDGKKEGKKEGMIEILKSMVEKGILTINIAAKEMGVSEAEFKKMIKV